MPRLISSLLKSVRFALWVPVILTTSAFAARAHAPISEGMLLGIGIAFAMGFGFVLNDLCDTEADTINARDRLNRLHPGERRRLFPFVAALAVGSLCSGLALGILYAGSLAVIVLLLVAYSLWARCRLVFANALAAILSVSPVWLPTALWARDFDIMAVATVAGCLLIVFGREIIFDVEDLAGDCLAGRKTIPMWLGIEKSVATSIVVQSIGTVIVALGAVFVSTKNHTMLPLWVPFVLAMGYGLVSLLREHSHSPHSYAAYTLWTRIAMMLIPILSYAG